MTQEEFNATGWGFNMQAVYQGGTYAIGSVDFGEKLVGLLEATGGEEDGHITWVRCENIALTNESRHTSNEGDQDGERMSAGNAQSLQNRELSQP